MRSCMFEHLNGIRKKRSMQATLAEKSYLALRQKLAAGDLASGDQLVKRQLATELGVSLAPLREAINRLTSEGLVEHVAGAGAFVRQLTRQDLEELYVLRDVIETRAATEAAKFITDIQLEELESICDEWATVAGILHTSPATVEQMDRWLNQDEHFHEILLDASRNRLLARVVREYRAISQVFDAQRRSPQILTHELADDTVDSHRQLVEALRNRDSQRAGQLVSEQIEKGRRTVLEYLRDVGQPPLRPLRS